MLFEQQLILPDPESDPAHDTITTSAISDSASKPVDKLAISPNSDIANVNESSEKDISRLRIPFQNILINLRIAALKKN